MIENVVILPEARNDLAEARAWYEDRSVGLGDRFLDCVDVDCLDGFGSTALRDAAQRGHLGGMKWLIRHGADFATQKDELLLAAVRCSHPKIVKWLLKRGCDVNAVGEQDGQNPLRHCYEYCDEEAREKMASLLRQYGAQFPPNYDPNALDKGECDDSDEDMANGSP